MANLSNIITPTNVLTETSTNTVTNKTLTDPKIVLGGTNGTVGQALLSQGAGVAPAWTTLGAAGGQYSAIASGAIASAGLVVSLNADGTVSTTTGNDASVTSPTAFTTVFTAIPVSAYDPVNKKVVVVFQDGSTGYPNAIVGTVTGTAISFGSSVVVTSVNSGDYSLVFDVTNSKFVIFYRGTSNYGYAKVGTVSGTTISFGAEATFYNLGITTNIASAYDTANAKTLLTFLDANALTTSSIVATVSGTTVSFGSSVLNPSGQSARNAIAYHAAQGSFVIAMARTSDGNRGWAAVATISGTSVSFGTAVRFSAINVAGALAATYDPVNQNVIIAYANDVPLSSFALCAIVSGTVISYGSPATITTSTAQNFQMSYDANVNRVVLVYTDSTSFGVAYTLRVSGTTISASTSFNFASTGIASPSIVYLAEALKPAVFYKLNSTNRANWLLYTPFVSTNNTRIGVAQSSAADGAAVTVKVQGGVDENQSGLTIGSTYYVASNGALTTTASSTNPRIGIALKANTLLITDSV
jgi:hypothetical protein